MLHLADQYRAKIEWQAETALMAGRSYLLLRGAEEIEVTITAIKYREHGITGEHLSSSAIHANEIAIVNLAAPYKFSFDSENNEPFQLLDLVSRELLGRGRFEFILRRASNIRWQPVTIDKTKRAVAKQQQPKCIWFTGLSGSGKSTIANLLEQHLYHEGRHTYLLDGDNLRHGLNRDLGFTEADRVENIRRVAEVARLMVDAGLIVIASFISPFRAERDMARHLFAQDEFIEVFVDTPLVTCEARDVKGLYAKARRGELKNFTGIDSEYERPIAPELTMDTCNYSADNCVEQIINYLENQ